MHPSMLSGFDLKSQRPKPFQFVFEIRKRYLKRYVVDGRSCCVRPAIARTLGAVEQREDLSVTTVATFSAGLAGDGERNR